MKRLTKMFLLTVLSIILLAGCGGQKSNGNADGSKNSSASALQRIKDKGVLVVASSNDVPFAYIDKDTKKFSGIDAEIITEVAKRLGIPKVEMKEVKFENLLLDLNNNNVDMVTDGMYIKPERQKIADFTNIWYTEGEALVVVKDSPIKGLDDLKDKVVGGQKGTAFLEFAQKLQKEGEIKEVKVFNSQSELLLAVNTNKIDACITDSAVAGYSITNDKTLNLKLVSPYKAEAAGNIGAAVRKSDKDLLDAVNKELDKMKEDGFILKTLKKYGLNEDNFVPAGK
ncbi:amino acid ABC transporter substrate-binding protein [Bacillus salipaludis]|uniref:Amino acid ABC transporter substrate-binding protein n=1 Tax=Bacillus salipaludis TaxID=2547811 RepID=A0A4R5VIN4_9BACI|nr:ABC transporter substrate-binding protein [Bacillus salipaludis]TDK55424.1 amino acid ABC transporter substrate-binding protein [Bacillus salipaludis]